MLIRFTFVFIFVASASCIGNYSLIFSCDSVGLGATVWKGSALNCPSTNNEIILLHNRVNSTSSCNDDNIVAWLVVNGSSIIISKARIINVTTELNGKSIVCFHDNGNEEKLIKNFTIDLDTLHPEVTTPLPAPHSDSGAIAAAIITMICIAGLTMLTVSALCVLRKKWHLITHCQILKGFHRNESVPTRSDVARPSEVCDTRRNDTEEEEHGVYSMCTFPNEENKIETNYNYSYPNMSKCTTPWNKELGSLAATYAESIKHDESLNLDSVLMKLNGRVNTEWYEFGMALGISTEFLGTLISYPDMECMVELVDYWLRNHPDRPTWKEIVDALEEIHYYDVASSIKGIYGSIDFDC